MNSRTIFKLWNPKVSAPKEEHILCDAIVFVDILSYYSSYFLWFVESRRKKSQFHQPKYLRQWKPEYCGNIVFLLYFIHANFTDQKHNSWGTWTSIVTVHVNQFFSKIELHNIWVFFSPVFWLQQFNCRSMRFKNLQQIFGELISYALQSLLGIHSYCKQ